MTGFIEHWDLASTRPVFLDSGSTVADFSLQDGLVYD